MTRKLKYPETVAGPIAVRSAKSVVREQAIAPATAAFPQGAGKHRDSRETTASRSSGPSESTRQPGGESLSPFIALEDAAGQADALLSVSLQALSQLSQPHSVAGVYRLDEDGEVHA